MAARITVFFYLTLLLLTMRSHAAGPETGPLVVGYGPVFPVETGAFNLANDRHYKVSKDVSASGQAPDERNRDLESAARFLNMQARNGTRPENLEMAVVVHGPAAKDVLNDAAYKARFGVDNPNTGLLTALGKAGAEMYLCGQTAAYRGFTAQELHPSVIMALSAMTAHVQLQSEDYSLIPF
jgi:intracellular sulfur oxidation DsrE/DsrF family protein